SPRRAARPHYGHRRTSRVGLHDSHAELHRHHHVRRVAAGRTAAAGAPSAHARCRKAELRRLPPLPHLKELYVNGRLWYDQPAPRLAATISLFAQSPALEKLVLSKPVQRYT